MPAGQAHTMHIPGVCLTGGGGLVFIMPVCLCPKGRKWVLFRLQVNEMNEKLSFKMGVKFAASFYLGKSYAMDNIFLICDQNSEILCNRSNVSTY